MVPRERLELSQPCGRQVLSLVRLPFRHLGAPITYANDKIKSIKGCSREFKIKHLRVNRYIRRLRKLKIR